MKKCFVCEKIKDLDQFYLNKRMMDGHINKCVSCVKEYSKSVYKKKNRADINTGRRKDYRRNKDKYLNWHLKRMYGITLEEYNQALLKQNGLCAICKLPGKLVVDHCHSTKQVRGLLHRTCNAAIGLLKDSAEVLGSAADYIRNNGVYR